MIRSWTIALLVAGSCCPMVQAAADSSQVAAPVPGPAIAREAGPGADSRRAAPAAGFRESRFPSRAERFRAWALGTHGPSALAGSAMSAAWGQWVTDEPPEWDGGREGFGKRFGTGMVTTAITETSLSLISEAMRQDAGYYRCPCTGFGPRLAHALRMTVLARDRDGVAVLSPAKIVAPFAGPLVTRTTLFPDRYGFLDGAESGAYGVLLNAGWNIAREFVLKSPRW